MIIRKALTQEMGPGVVSTVFLLLLLFLFDGFLFFFFGGGGELEGVLHVWGQPLFPAPCPFFSVGFFLGQRNLGLKRQAFPRGTSCRPC